MAIKQISVFVENKKGKLAEIIKTVSEANINIQAMSLADTKDFGILRLIVSDTDKALKLLSEDTIVKTTDVLAVKMDDIEGALYKVLQALDEADIIITNPPFSLFHEFLDWIFEKEKSFICSMLIQYQCLLMKIFSRLVKISTHSLHITSKVKILNKWKKL